MENAYSELQIANPLTERELEVLQLIAEGLSNQEIGQRLILTLYTVKWYVKQIYSKLQLSSRAQATNVAREMGLFHPHSVTHNLPATITPLVGRQPELDELASYLVDAEVRQVSILGPGGIGKTRFALEAARQNMDHFEHGARFVALAGIESAEHLVAAIADAASFQFYSPHEPRQQLINYFREKHMLLLLDNFEHLLDGADLVSDLLANAPLLKVLVTSRQHLNIYGEVRFGLGGLRYPEPDEEAQAKTFPAVQLFLERARRANPQMQVTPAVETTTARICRLVEGLPLAIELAAAWTMSLTSEQIADEIERSLDFLQANTRDVSERHRSIHAVFDHSYALLSGEERAILRKLSVFRGGFTVEAATAISGASLKVLAALQGASLVRRDGMERFGLHELVRQYSTEKLAENSDEHAAVLRDHSRYFLEYAGKWADALKVGDQAAALEKIEQDLDNIRQAWVWSIKHSDISALDEATGLWFFYEIRGLYREGYELFDAAIRASTEQNEATLGRLLAGQCVFAFRLGQIAHSETMSHESVALLRKHGRHQETSLPLLNLGNIVRSNDGPGAARKVYEKALEIATDADDEWAISAALDLISMTIFDEGNVAEARDIAYQAYEVKQTLYDLWGLSFNLIILGECAWHLGELKEAERLFTQALENAHYIDQRLMIAGALSNLGDIALSTGDIANAFDCFQEAWTSYKQMGNRQEEIDVLRRLINVQSERGDLEAARAYACTALRNASEMDSDTVLLSALTGLATYLMAFDKPVHAVELLALIDNRPHTSETMRTFCREKVSLLQQQMSQSQFDDAWAHGSKLDLRETVKLAIDNWCR